MDDLITLPRRVVAAFVGSSSDYTFVRDGYRRCDYCGDGVIERDEMSSSEWEELVEHQEDCPVRIAQEALATASAAPPPPHNT